MKRGPTGQAPSNRPSKRASIRAPSPNTLISPGEGGAAASSAIVKFVCVKRAAVRDGCDQQTSRRTGFVNVGACINALERRTNENGVVRVRFERGWVSCTSQKGDLLLQPVVGPPRPVIKLPCLLRDLLIFLSRSVETSDPIHGNPEHFLIVAHGDPWYFFFVSPGGIN